MLKLLVPVLLLGALGTSWGGEGAEYRPVSRKVDSNLMTYYRRRKWKN